MDIRAYTQFDIEANIVEQKAKDMEITSYCFTNVANLYKDIISKTMIGKKDKDRDAFKDNYGDSIEKLWVELEIDKEPCECLTCRNHVPQWCERIIRQRQINSPIRTCPVCQQEIPKDEYEVYRKYSSIYEGMNYFDFHTEICARDHGINFDGDCHCDKCKERKEKAKLYQHAERDHERQHSHNISKRPKLDKSTRKFSRGQ